MKKPNYHRAAAEAYKLLEKSNSCVFPISLYDIIDCFENLKVFTFHEMAMLLDISVEMVSKKMALSEEGAIGTFGTDQVIIIYNSDLDSKNLGRERFTLAHEIGHFILGHPFHSDNSILSRNNGITSEENRIFEIEANHFARELLAPTFLVDDVEPLTIEKVSERFEVSNELSSYAIDRVKKGRSGEGLFYLNLRIPQSWQTNHPAFIEKITYVKKTVNIDKIGMIFTGEGLKFIYKKIRYCFKCRSIQSYDFKYPLNYCSCCGSNTIKEIIPTNYFEFHEREEQRLMSYVELKVNETGTLIEDCPICGNDHVKDNFCSVCGVPIVNKCSGMSKTGDNWNGGYEEDQPCSNTLLGSDRYCSKCGAESTFYYHGLLKDWNTEIDDPFQSPTVDINDVKLPF
ncbi:ImmA/IrrE family metallo-endopeptidase [Enterococcus gilvus]|uniref:ImmA/IrrE family metallo-endopeptidase n=1 Tax=Enterococcus gilvus TaxID=160453 RepID=UPI0028D7B440|nr:ImmA/IrrE family metallo-endopeptidase [Enterococcus gilvus]